MNRNKVGETVVTVLGLGMLVAFILWIALICVQTNQKNAQLKRTNEINRTLKIQKMKQNHEEYYKKREAAKESTSVSGKSSYSSGTKKSSSTTMPDVDDYEDYDDFVDDWDGNLPDGSDAEDYYENW